MSIMRISDEKAVAEYSNSIVDIANMSWNHLVTGYAYAQDDQLMRVILLQNCPADPTVATPNLRSLQCLTELLEVDILIEDQFVPRARRKSWLSGPSWSCNQVHQTAKPIDLPTNCSLRGWLRNLHQCLSQRDRKLGSHHPPWNYMKLLQSNYLLHIQPHHTTSVYNVTIMGYGGHFSGKMSLRWSSALPKPRMRAWTSRIENTWRNNFSSSHI